MGNIARILALVSSEAFRKINPAVLPRGFVCLRMVQVCSSNEIPTRGNELRNLQYTEKVSRRHSIAAESDPERKFAPLKTRIACMPATAFARFSHDDPLISRSMSSKLRIYDECDECDE